MGHLPKVIPQPRHSVALKQKTDNGFSLRYYEKGIPKKYNRPGPIGNIQHNDQLTLHIQSL
jgi:hypothetical protein